MSADARVLVVGKPLPTSPEALASSTAYRFAPRGAAERSLLEKQVIPYIIVGSPAGVLIYRRARSTTERRLRGAWAIGWGGHIEPVDELEPVDEREPASPLRQLINRCAEREIREELGLLPAAHRVELGLIDDDAEEVGRHHLAWVEYWYYPDPAVENDADTASALRWMRPDDIALQSVALERWSRLALNVLIDRQLYGKVDS